MGTRELEQWIRQLCGTTLPVSSMNELAERCVTEGWETVGEVLAAVLPEPDLASLGLINYVAVHRSERAVGCTGDNEGRRATAGSDSGAGCCGGKDAATSADPDAAAPAAVASAGRLCVVGMGLGVGIGIGLAFGSLIALKLFRVSGVKGKDAIGLVRGYKRS
jgi:hypothetical protein